MHACTDRLPLGDLKRTAVPKYGEDVTDTSLEFACSCILRVDFRKGSMSLSNCGMVIGLTVAASNSAGSAPDHS